MLKAVYEYSKERNGFEYNREEEIEMYKQEVKEFFDASTTEERLESLCRCAFIRYGTMMKRAYNGFDDVLPYERTPESLMVSVLLEEIPKPIFDEVLRAAENIVGECILSTDKDIPDATSQIDVLLKDTITAYFMRQDKQNEMLLRVESESTKNP